MPSETDWISTGRYGRMMIKRCTNLRLLYFTVHLRSPSNESITGTVKYTYK